MRKFFTSFRRTEPASVAAIQRELTALRQQHQQMTAARDRLAHDAVTIQGAAMRHRHLDDAAADIARRMAVLTAALPAAEEREAEATRQAEADAHAQRMERFRQQTAEAQRWLDGVLARLPTGEELTEARHLRDGLREEARCLSSRSRDVAVRRPVDPLDAIYAALGHRIQRVERARWAKSAPITLLDDTKAAS